MVENRSLERLHDAGDVGGAVRGDGGGDVADRAADYGSGRASAGGYARVAFTSDSRALTTAVRSTGAPPPAPTFDTATAILPSSSARALTRPVNCAHVTGSAEPPSLADELRNPIGEHAEVLRDASQAVCQLVALAVGALREAWLRHATWRRRRRRRRRRRLAGRRSGRRNRLRRRNVRRDDWVGPILDVGEPRHFAVGVDVVRGFLCCDPRRLPLGNPVVVVRRV